MFKCLQCLCCCWKKHPSQRVDAEEEQIKDMILQFEAQHESHQSQKQNQHQTQLKLQNPPQNEYQDILGYSENFNNNISKKNINQKEELQLLISSKIRQKVKPSFQDLPEIFQKVVDNAYGYLEHWEAQHIGGNIQLSFSEPNIRSSKNIISSNTKNSASTGTISPPGLSGFKGSTKTLKQNCYSFLVTYTLTCSYSHLKQQTRSELLQSWREGTIQRRRLVTQKMGALEPRQFVFTFHRTSGYHQWWEIGYTDQYCMKETMETIDQRRKGQGFYLTHIQQCPLQKPKQSEYSLQKQCQSQQGQLQTQLRVSSYVQLDMKTKVTSTVINKMKEYFGKLVQEWQREVQIL